jgi:hypothetical protein
MFAHTSDHLRIRVGLFATHEPWTERAIRKLCAYTRRLPPRYVIHAVVLGVALATAVAGIGG